jgi:CRISPR/Cas system Type II protein with McrA/HNH and RuvC-like nuclease domain
MLIKALNEAKKLIPYAEELVTIDIPLRTISQVAHHTVQRVEEVLSELKNVENNPLADEDTKKSARDILKQYAQYLEQCAQDKAKKALKKKVSFPLRKKVIFRDNSTCQYCGKELNKKGIHIDHVIPYSLGGRTELDNLVVACAECNLKKSGHTLEEVNMKIINESHRTKNNSPI